MSCEAEIGWHLSDGSSTALWISSAGSRRRLPASGACGHSPHPAQSTVLSNPVPRGTPQGHRAAPWTAQGGPWPRAPHVGGRRRLPELLIQRAVLLAPLRCQPFFDSQDNFRPRASIRRLTLLAAPRRPTLPALRGRGEGSVGRPGFRSAGPRGFAPNRWAGSSASPFVRRGARLQR